METLQSLRDTIQSVKKSNSEAGLGQISASDPKPGPSKQSNDLPVSRNTQSNTNQPNIRTSDEPTKTDFCWPALPPQFGQKIQSQFRSDPKSEKSECVCLVKPSVSTLNPLGPLWIRSPYR